MGRNGITFLLVLLFIGTNAQALTNSQAAFNDSSTFNVWMQIEGEDRGESYTGMCNGSLIADDLVVTAAHCVSGSYKHQNGTTVHIGKYITKQGKKTTFTAYFPMLESIKSKKIIYLNSAKNDIQSGRIDARSNIKATEDIALIQLERPIDRSKVDVQLVNVVSPQEHSEIIRNSGNYTFISVSINLLTEMSMHNKRYAEIKGVKFGGFINKTYGIPMINPIAPTSTEEGDSGAPVLVNIGGQWKLFAVVKGTKRDFLSSKLEEWTDTPMNITPAVNMFVPVAHKMCDLLAQANLACN